MKPFYQQHPHRYLLMALASLLTGCAAFSSTPSRVDSHFGEAVHAMQIAQTYNPETRQHPSSEVIMSRDGKKALSVLNTTYRGDVLQMKSQHSESDKVRHDVNIGLDQ